LIDQRSELITEPSAVAPDAKLNSEYSVNHAFRFVESVVFLIGPTNVRSQKGVEKIGGVLIERREKTNPDGTTVERVVYQIKKPTNTAST
jgi:hypothetical protein